MSSSEGKTFIQHGLNETFVTFKESELLDEVVINQIGTELETAIREWDGDHWLLDFSQVNFMSSSFLGLLVKVHKQVADKQGTLRLCNIDEKILKVFKITQLDKVFKIE